LTTSPIAGKQLQDMDFPEGVLVGGVLKDGKMSKLRADLRIEDGDIVAIFAMASQVAEVEVLLQVSIDFF
jgi:trk system potassium uptake protein TrkA